MTEWSFSKYAGLGNHFIFIDNRKGLFPARGEDIRQLCHPLTGIGADGLILVEDSKIGDFKMRIFNADGSEAEMCGNGLRCFYKFLRELGHCDSSYIVETMHRTLSVFSDPAGVRCELGEVPFIRWGVNVDLGIKTMTGHFLNTGVPHFVVVCRDVRDVDAFREGQALRHHPEFGPAGTNVNFLSREESGALRIRTYERGVEKETAACGTGCAAAAVVARNLYGLSGPVTVTTSLGESLQFHFSAARSNVLGLEMTGEASFIFKGTVKI